MARGGQTLVAIIVTAILSVTSPCYAGVVPNGRELNGRELNGRELNGRELNGRRMNGASLDSATFNGVALGRLSLEGAVLTVIADDESILSGSDVVGVELSGILDDGSEIPLRVDGVDTPEGENMPFYTVSYQAENDDGELTTYPLCGYDEDDNPIQAIALSGLWNYGEGVAGGGDKIDDPSAFTFACQGYALAKCVELGYMPWETAIECKSSSLCHEISLAHHHQSCVRMLRADFCGDGMPHTADGILVNLWDALGIQTQASTPLWPFEAEWGSEGATCISLVRLYSLDLGTFNPFDTIADYVSVHCPDNMMNLMANLTCGGPSSSFYVTNGFATPQEKRSFIMSKRQIWGLP